MSTVSMWKGIGTVFVNAFNSFKEAWTGKIASNELKKISHEVHALGVALTRPLNWNEEKFRARRYVFHAATPTPEKLPDADGEQPGMKSSS